MDNNNDVQGDIQKIFQVYENRKDQLLKYAPDTLLKWLNEIKFLDYFEGILKKLDASMI
jgi:hypothetical protein